MSFSYFANQYFDSVMAAIPDSNNTAVKSRALDTWLDEHEEWGFCAKHLTAICRKVSTSNSAVLSSIASKLVGTFEPHICGGCNHRAVIALMTAEGLRGNISSVSSVFDRLLPSHT